MNVIDFLQRGAIVNFGDDNNDGVIPKLSTAGECSGELSALTPVNNDEGEKDQVPRSRAVHGVLKSGGGNGPVSVSIQSISQPLQVLPFPQHTCELCRSSFESQFKFFEHLKSHYENVPSTSASSTENKKKKKQLSPKSTNARVSRVEGSPGTDGSGDLPQISGLSITTDSNNVSKTGFPKNGSTESRKEEQNVIAPHSAISKHKTKVKLIKPILQTVKEKLSLTCPKCRKAFRKEQNFKLHFDCCQKYSESAEIPIQEADDTTELIENDYDDVFDDDFNPSPLGNNIQTLEDDEEETDMMYQQSNICPSCDEHCQTKDNLDKHLLDKHPDLIFKKKKAGEPSAATKTSDVLKCQQCPKIFHHRNSLIYHMRSHTGERPYECDTCGKRFFASSALKVHKRLHSGVRPYPCELCGQQFRQWGDLKYHKISIHSGEKSYQCEFCGKKFARKYSLTVHRRIHTGEREYKCVDCPKCFRAASYLQNHRRIHTGEKPHKCPTCGRPFRVRSDMNRHMASHNRDAKRRTGSDAATITVQSVPVNLDNGAGSSDPKLFPVISSSSPLSPSKIVPVNDSILVQRQQSIPIITSISTGSEALPPLNDPTNSSNFKTERSEEVCLSGPTSNQSAQNQLIASDGTAYKVTLADGSSVYSTSDIITTTMVSEGVTIYQDTGQNLEVLAEQVTQTNTVVLVPLTHTFIQD